MCVLSQSFASEARARSPPQSSILRRGLWFVVPNLDHDQRPVKVNTVQLNGASTLYVLPATSLAVILTTLIRVTSGRNLAPPAPVKHPVRSPTPNGRGR